MTIARAFRKLFSRNKRRPTRRTTSRRPCFESLQQRQLLAVDVVIEGGVLAIMGDDDPNRVVVTEETVVDSWAPDLAVTYLKVTSDDDVVGRYLADEVSRVTFNGQDGDDFFENRTDKRSIADGGEGNDVLIGGNKSDALYGRQGHDLLQGKSGDDRLYGNQGNDRLYGNQGRDLLFGNLGNDRLYGNQGNDRLYGNQGHDLLFGNLGNDRLYGNQGNDRLYGNQGHDLLFGNLGNDRLYGNQGNDRLYGNQGRDLLFGNLGNDRLYGNHGNDRLYGGQGRDLLAGGLGNDQLFGRSGEDYLRDMSGHNRLNGLYAYESLESASILVDGEHEFAGPLLMIVGTDFADEVEISEERRDDSTCVRSGTCSGGPRVNTTIVAHGTVKLYDKEIELFEYYTNDSGMRRRRDIEAPGIFFDGRGGSDSLETDESVQRKIFANGGDGDDHIQGGSENDFIFGGRGNDVVNGRGGADTIYGGDGDDRLYGSDGNDTVFGDAHQSLCLPYSYCQQGNDVIFGGPGEDNLYGDAGNDAVYGGLDDDVIYGSNERLDSLLVPLSDMDLVDGGEGNNTIHDGGVIEALLEGLEETRGVLNDTLESQIQIPDSLEFSDDPVGYFAVGAALGAAMLPVLPVPGIALVEGILGVHRIVVDQQIASGRTDVSRELTVGFGVGLDVGAGGTLSLEGGIVASNNCHGEVERGLYGSAGGGISDTVGLGFHAALTVVFGGIDLFMGQAMSAEFGASIPGTDIGGGVHMLFSDADPVKPIGFTISLGVGVDVGDFPTPIVDLGVSTSHTISNINSVCS